MQATMAINNINLPVQRLTNMCLLLVPAFVVLRDGLIRNSNYVSGLGRATVETKTSN